MKIHCCAVLLLLLGALLASADNQLVIKDDSPVCNKTLLSCHWDGAKVDSCCSPTYGLVVLSLQWVENLGPNDDFTIHGLWPDTCSGGRAPSRGCDPRRVSNQIGPIIRSKNPALYQELNSIWPSYKGDNNWFWSHEWTKHGSCVSTLRPKCYGDTYEKYQDVVDYFQKTVDLHAEYDLFGALNLAGVSPGRQYQTSTMMDALRNAFGKKVKIDCDRSGKLSEISLFFYVQGRDTYVLTDAVHRGTCRQTVYFPRK
ncbi:ribonuclease T2-like protein [Gongronella butleri]|nr:ribonuclease T2-like protein [Gongronella butleri]